MIAIRHLPLVALAMALTGCISTVDVKKIDRTDKVTRGLRYSLPATFLLVQPQADGTATYNWVYLPDPDQTYVLTKTSILSKFTLDVATSNGLLTSVQGQGDTSGVASKLFDAAQSVYSAKVGADSKAKTADATSASTLKSAVVAAQLVYDQAAAEKAIVDADASSNAGDKRAAAIKVSNADLALKQAQGAAAAKGVAFDVAGGGGTGAGGAAGPAVVPQYGPVLFRVMQGSDGLVQLVAMKPQAQYDTITAQAAPAPAPTKLNPQLVTGQKFVSSPKMKLKFTVDVPICDIDLQHSPLTMNLLPQAAQTSANFSADKKTVEITFQNRLSPGAYTFTPALIRTAGGQSATEASLNFTVVRAH